MTKPGGSMQHRNSLSTGKPGLGKISQNRRMQIRRPFYFKMCMSVCSFLSFGSAGIHYLLIAASFLKAPPYILNSPGGTFSNLRNIWCTRFFIRSVSVLLRTPIRLSVLKLVNFITPLSPHSGCVVLTCHTPWKRLLVEWCLENDFALIVSRGSWGSEKRRIQRVGTGFKELRDMVNLLKQNGRIIIAADIFNNLKNCPVNFNGISHNASLFPVRLARIAEVPLVVAIPTLRNGVINIDPQRQFDFKPLRFDASMVMQKIISFLDSEIKKDPCIWSLFVKGHY